MRLYYFKEPPGNFGDDMNAWLWPRLVPDMPRGDDGTRLSGIGTIINARMPQAQRWIVFGSGAGYGRPPVGFGGPGWHVIAVRGPLTAHVLGVPATLAITDGALLLSLLPEWQPAGGDERHGTVFVPHHYSARDGRWREVAERAGVEYLDPRGESRAVMQRIRTAKLVLADAMHAAIVADAMRVPWVPLSTSNRINTFKWLDWTMSMDVPYQPTALPSSSLTDRVLNATFFLWGNDFAFRPPSFDAAVAHFRKQSRLRSLPGWRTYATYAQKAFSSLPKRVLASDAATRIAGDDRRIARAAEVLRRVSERPGYLSDDRHFERRTAEMSAGLETLRTIVGSLRPPTAG